MLPPPFLIIYGITYLFTKKIPVWLTPITLFHSSKVTSAGLLAPPPIPALASKQSILPNTLTTISILVLTSFSFDTSHLIPSTLPPNFLLISRTLSLTSNKATLAPSISSLLALASPIPLAPPVITTTLSLNIFINSYSEIYYTMIFLLLQAYL